MTNERYKLGMNVDRPAPMVSREGIPSEEEIRRVRNHECRMSGHSFDTILSLGGLEPHLLVCSNCGRRWPVGEGEGGAS